MSQKLESATLHKIVFPTEQIAELCRRHHIRRLALFGSILREDFGGDSDVDILIEFERDHTPGLRFFAIQKELSDLIGRQVDLNTPAFLSKYFRENVVKGARNLYVAA